MCRCDRADRCICAIFVSKLQIVTRKKYCEINHAKFASISIDYIRTIPEIEIDIGKVKV